LEIQKRLEGMVQANGEVLEGQELNALSRTLEFIALFEPLHYYDGGAMFLQHISGHFLYAYPPHASELTDIKLN
jgi:hypothetical protein